MKKQIIIGSVAALSLIGVPMIAQARQGADNATGNIRQEDKKAQVAGVTTTHDSNDDKKVTVTAPGVLLSSTSSTTPTTTVPASDTSTDTTKEEATAIAQKAFPDKTVKEVEKESEHGTTIWEVKFTDGSEVSIDASTGKIVDQKDDSTEKDDSNDDKSTSNSGSNSGSANRSGRSHVEDN